MNQNPDSVSLIEDRLRAFLHDQADSVPLRPLALPADRRRERHFRARRQIGAALLVAAAATGIFAVSRVSVPRGTTVAGTASASRSVNYATEAAANGTAQREMSRALDGLQGSDDASFGGAWIAPEGIVVAMVGQPSTQLAAALAALESGDVPTHSVPVDHSLAQLRTLSQRISQDMPYWHGQDIEISAVGPDQLTNRVLIALTNYSAQAVQGIEAHYVGQPVHVVDHSERASAG
jgi:hypothetical protein